MKYYWELLKYKLGFSDWHPYKARISDKTKGLWKAPYTGKYIVYTRAGDSLDYKITLPKGTTVDTSKLTTNSDN